MELGFELFGDFCFLPDFLIQLELFLTHPLIFLHHRFIPNGNTQHAGHHQKCQHHPCELVPDALRNVHQRE